MVSRVGLPVRVLLADDHSLVRQGLEQLLESAAGIDLVGSVRTGLEALALCDTTEPDVVLLDLSVPAVDALEATRRIVAAHPRVRVIVLATVPDRHRHMQAVAAGAVAHCLKDVEPAELIRTIRRVAAAPSAG
jgi:DNA-binding NarL/FixJ family response regulator